MEREITDSIIKETLSYIRQKRIKLGFSQEYVAHEMGISQAAYSKIEKGITEITFRNLLRIINILQLSETKFLKKISRIIFQAKNG